ncbi:hypothetical protein HK100_000588 [Physocladia obscura]|uniref:Uncharacterized protein n=1 Tax=Physocladia obscura TaxID=109957 RepID=A0AAD5SYE3_9FUNG|nr:hypothetical protein HK100_000588 [Physocladia obscura]
MSGSSSGSAEALQEMYVAGLAGVDIGEYCLRANRSSNFAFSTSDALNQFSGWLPLCAPAVAKNGAVFSALTDFDGNVQIIGFNTKSSINKTLVFDASVLGGFFATPTNCNLSDSPASSHYPMAKLLFSDSQNCLMFISASANSISPSGVSINIAIFNIDANKVEYFAFPFLANFQEFDPILSKDGSTLFVLASNPGNATPCLLQIFLDAFSDVSVQCQPFSTFESQTITSFMSLSLLDPDGSSFLISVDGFGYISDWPGIPSLKLNQTKVGGDYSRLRSIPNQQIDEAFSFYVLSVDSLSIVSFFGVTSNSSAPWTKLWSQNSTHFPVLKEGGTIPAGFDESRQWMYICVNANNEVGLEGRLLALTTTTGDLIWGGDNSGSIPCSRDSILILEDGSVLASSITYSNVSLYSLYGYIGRSTNYTVLDWSAAASQVSAPYAFTPVVWYSSNYQDGFIIASSFSVLFGSQAAVFANISNFGINTIAPISYDNGDRPIKNYIWNSSLAPFNTSIEKTVIFPNNTTQVENGSGNGGLSTVATDSHESQNLPSVLYKPSVAPLSSNVFQMPPLPPTHSLNSPSVSGPPVAPSHELELDKSIRVGILTTAAAVTVVSVGSDGLASPGDDDIIYNTADAPTKQRQRSFMSIWFPDKEERRTSTAYSDVTVRAANIRQQTFTATLPHSRKSSVATVRVASLPQVVSENHGDLGVILDTDESEYIQQDSHKNPPAESLYEDDLTRIQTTNSTTLSSSKVRAAASSSNGDRPASMSSSSGTMMPLKSAPSSIQNEPVEVIRSEQELNRNESVEIIGNEPELPQDEPTQSTASELSESKKNGPINSVIENIYTKSSPVDELDSFPPLPHSQSQSLSSILQTAATQINAHTSVSPTPSEDDMQHRQANNSHRASTRSSVLSSLGYVASVDASHSSSSSRLSNRSSLGGSGFWGVPFRASMRSDSPALPLPDGESRAASRTALGVRLGGLSSGGQPLEIGGSEFVEESTGEDIDYDSIGFMTAPESLSSRSLNRRAGGSRTTGNESDGFVTARSVVSTNASSKRSYVTASEGEAIEDAGEN